MENNLIQWPKAVYWTKTYNPMVGCEPISPACDNCYARAWAERFKIEFRPHEGKTKKPPRSGVCFCGNVTDLFGDWNRIHRGCGYVHRAYDYISETLGYDKTNPYKDKATYIWLTKRVDNMAETLIDGGWESNKDYWSEDADTVDFCDCDLSNHYYGFTAENQEWFDSRIEDWVMELGSRLEHINWWVSCEPLLGDIDLLFPAYVYLPRLVVVGCESGPKRRPCKIEWVESIVEQCRANGVPVFVKQLDIKGKCETDINKFPKYLQIRQVPWATEKNQIEGV